MIEPERLQKINLAAAEHLEDWLKQLSNEEIDGDGLIAGAYGVIIAAILVGYDPNIIVEDAKRGAEYIIKNFGDDDE